MSGLTMPCCFGAAQRRVVLAHCQHSNHSGSHGDRILQLFRDAATIAPGSYGLLYVLDDDDQAGRANEYRAFRMLAMTRPGRGGDVQPFATVIDRVSIGVGNTRASRHQTRQSCR